MDRMTNFLNKDLQFNQKELQNFILLEEIHETMAGSLQSSNVFILNH